MIEKTETETEKEEIDEKVKKISEYLLIYYHNEIVEKLGSSIDENEFHLHIEVTKQNQIFVILEDEETFNNNKLKIDIDVERIKVDDDYDFYDEYNDYAHFEDSFNFLNYIEDKIRENLTDNQINKFYNIIFDYDAE